MGSSKDGSDLMTKLTYAKMCCQLCSTCFTTFVMTQHVLKMVGYGEAKRVELGSNIQSARHASTLSSSRRSVDLLEVRATRPHASTSTRILRAACFAEMMFSITGALSTALSLHNPELSSTFKLVFWARGPHWAMQVAAFCWMGALAMYMTQRNRHVFDVAIAHALIWLVAFLYWVLEMYTVYEPNAVYLTKAAMIVWMSTATANCIIVAVCWVIVVHRWRQQYLRRENSFVTSKLLSYAMSFVVFVLPIVLDAIIDGLFSSDPIQMISSCMLALYPTSNAIICVTPPMNCFSHLLQRKRNGHSNHPHPPHPRGPGNMVNGAQLLMSPTQHELKGLEIGDKIGEGIAVVYKGKWRGIEVAVKMRTLMLDPTENLEEFQHACNLEIQQEAEVMKTLCHPNIVLFMEAGFCKGSICIVSEYCQRGSLRDVLKRSNVTQLSWSTKLRLALGICHGIQYLHNANPPMIHRDLKSPNVLVDNSWHAKIADFGTLRFAEIVSSVQQLHASRNDVESMVMTGLVGTTRWMAPEVIRGDKHYTHKVDIYSLGLILWELIEGKLPFESLRWNYAIEDLVLKGERLPVDTNLCPLRWRHLVNACWHADPVERPNIQEVISSLQRIAREETLDTTAPRFTGLSASQCSESTVSGMGASMRSMISTNMASFASNTSSFLGASMQSAAPGKRATTHLDSSFISLTESEQEEDDDLRPRGESFIPLHDFLQSRILLQSNNPHAVLSPKTFHKLADGNENEMINI